jgi:hypothetical protein
MTYHIDSTSYDKARVYPVYHGYATRPSSAYHDRRALDRRRDRPDAPERRELSV